MQKDGKLAGADLLAGLLFIALGAFVVSVASDMKVFRMLRVSPGLFPLILGWIFVFCGGILGFMAVKRGGIRDAARILAPASVGAVVKSPTFKRGCIILGLILVYVALFGNRTLAKLNIISSLGGQVFTINVGFILITTAFLFVTFTYLKAMRWFSALTVSLCAAVIVFLAFNQGFGIPIP